MFGFLNLKFRAQNILGNANDPFVALGFRVTALKVHQTLLTIATQSETVANPEESTVDIRRNTDRNNDSGEESAAVLFFWFLVQWRFFCGVGRLVLKERFFRRLIIKGIVELFIGITFSFDKSQTESPPKKYPKNASPTAEKQQMKINVNFNKKQKLQNGP